MNKRLFAFFISIITVLLHIPTYGMQHRSNDYDTELWVKTSEQTVMCIPTEVVQYCHRLKLTRKLFSDYGKYHNPLPVQFTAEELMCFVPAMMNFEEAIKHVDDINLSLDDFLLSVMSVAQRCRAGELYALCLNRLFHEYGVEQIDKKHIVPFLQAIKPTLMMMIDEKGNSENMICTPCEAIEEVLTTNGTYSLKCHTLFHEENINIQYDISDMSDNVVFSFESLAYCPAHLFHDKNVVLYVKYTGENNFFQLCLYDLDQKHFILDVIACDIQISRDKKYITCVKDSALWVYNCQDCDNIRIKQYPSCYAGRFSPDGNAFSFVKEEHGAYHLYASTMEKFDWDNQSEPGAIHVHTSNANFENVSYLSDNQSLLFSSSSIQSIKKNVFDSNSLLHDVKGLFVGFDQILSVGQVSFLLKVMDDFCYEIYDTDNINHRIANGKATSALYNPHFPWSIALFSQGKLCVGNYKKENNIFEICQTSQDCYNNEFFRINDNNWFIASACPIFPAERISRNGVIVHDEHGNALMQITSQGHPIKASFFNKNDTVGIACNKKTYTVPSFYLKPLAYDAQLTSSQMVLLMSLNLTVNQFPSLQAHDPIDTILSKFGDKKQEVQKRLGIQYKK